ncbi:Zinc import ATP-binding protein ZnuC, partial [Dysosmobacter welbionis]
RPKSFATSWTLYFSIPNRNTSFCSNPRAGKFFQIAAADTCRGGAVRQPSFFLRKEPLPFFTGRLLAYGRACAFGLGRASLGGRDRYGFAPRGRFPSGARSGGISAGGLAAFGAGGAFRRRLPWRRFFSWAACSARRSAARRAFTSIRSAASAYCSGSSSASRCSRAAASPTSVTAAMATAVRPRARPSSALVKGSWSHRQSPAWAKCSHRRRVPSAASAASSSTRASRARATASTGSS